MDQEGFGTGGREEIKTEGGPTRVWNWREGRNKNRGWTNKGLELEGGKKQKQRVDQQGFGAGGREETKTEGGPTRVWSWREGRNKNRGWTNKGLELEGGKKQKQRVDQQGFGAGGREETKTEGGPTRVWSWREGRNKNRGWTNKGLELEGGKKQKQRVDQQGFGTGGREETKTEGGPTRVWNWREGRNKNRGWTNKGLELEGGKKQKQRVDQKGFGAGGREEIKTEAETNVENKRTS